jgi:ribosomal-protein-alanine N-acetyltransferase
VFALRDYRPEDFDELWRIDQSCFEPGIAYTRFELMAYIRSRSAFTLVAETKDLRIAGFVVAQRRSNGSGHIITIDVREAFRRSGLGSTLLGRAEAMLAERGSRGVVLETAVSNVSALTFYKRHGYEVVKTIPRYYKDSVDALVMVKKLPL